MACSLSRTTVLFTLLLIPVTLAGAPAGGRLHEGGFGFDKLVLVHRYPVESSHPYTFFYMDYRKGGGLYVYDLKAKSQNRIVDSSDGQILNADLDFDGRSAPIDRRRAFQLRSLLAGRRWHRFCLSPGESVGLLQLRPGRHPAPHG